MNKSVNQLTGWGRKLSPSLKKLCSIALLACFCLLASMVHAQNFSLQGSRIMAPDGAEFIPKGANIGLWSKQYDATNVDFFKNYWKLNTARVYTKIGWKFKKDANNVVIDTVMADPNNYPTDAFMDAYVNAYTTNTNGPRTVVMFECHDKSGSFYSASPTSIEDTSLDSLVQFWKRVATRYKNNPYVWFNIMNEPGYTQNVSATPWYTMHKTVIQAIRSVGANNIIVCDGMGYGTEDGGNKAINVPDAKSAVLTYGQQLLNDDPAHNVVYSYHIYQGWVPGGVPKMAEYIDRVKAKGLALFVGEFAAGNPGNGWDVTDAAITMWNTIVSRNIGWLVWHWNPGDGNRWTTTSASGLGIDKTDGTRPTNLTWLGSTVWDNTHSIAGNNGVPLNRADWVLSASNASASYPVGNARDGNLNSSYASGANQTAGMWFQIDLRTAKSFNRVVLACAGADNDYPRGYKVLVSNDASAWSEVANVPTNAFSDVNISFASQTARYIRVELMAAASNWWGIREAFVYTLGDEKQFVANYYSVTGALSRTGWVASASHATAEAPKALDGDLYSRFTTGTGSAPGQWFQVDMQSARTFDKLRLHTGNSDPMAPYQVLVSNDANTWTQVAAGLWNNYVYSVGGSSVEYISFSQQNARYIRIELTGSKGGWWSLHDFQAYGTTQSTSLTPVADAFVFNGAVDTNYGSATYMHVKNDGAPYGRNAYLKFDLSSANTIGTAKLRIYASHRESTAFAIRAFGVANTSWTESGITWNNQPAMGTTVQGRVNINPGAAAWYEIDVTSYVKAEKAAGRNTITLALHNGIKTTSVVYIHSKENTANQPVLVLSSGAARVGIAGETLDESVRVYPNPANNQVKVTFRADYAQQVGLRLTNLSARSLSYSTYQAEAGENTLKVPVENLENGMYFLTLQHNGKQVTKKVLIAR